MGCYTPWIFLDDAGNTWALGVSSSGKLTFSEVIPPAPQAMRQVPLTDLITEQVYGLSVTYTSSGPKIVTSGPLSIPAIGLYIPMSNAGRTFWLQVANGQLFGSWKTAGGSTDPVVGQLFNLDMVNPALNPPNLPNAGIPSGLPGGWLPNYSQPGGLGGQTLPAQQSGTPYSEEPSDAGLPVPDTGTPYELGMGLNVCADGHWFNCWDITFTTVNCGPAAIVRCPLCGYIQEIISPASRLYTDPGFDHISS